MVSVLEIIHEVLVCVVSMEFWRASKGKDTVQVMEEFV